MLEKVAATYFCEKNMKNKERQNVCYSTFW